MVAFPAEVVLLISPAFEKLCKPLPEYAIWPLSERKSITPLARLFKVPSDISKSPDEVILISLVLLRDAVPTMLLSYTLVRLIVKSLVKTPPPVNPEYDQSINPSPEKSSVAVVATLTVEVQFIAPDTVPVKFPVKFTVPPQVKNESAATL